MCQVANICFSSELPTFMKIVISIVCRFLYCVSEFTLRIFPFDPVLFQLFCYQIVGTQTTSSIEKLPWEKESITD